jgi:integrase
VSKAYVTARVFTREEIRGLLLSVDQLPIDPRSRIRHIVMPTLFRVLYGCGLRLGEALRLTVADVDLQRGILTIREGKFRRDRLVPVAPALQRRLQEYANALAPRNEREPFFPSPRGGAYDPRAIYQTFRQLLRATGIAHGGRGHGPRLHEIRHAFAVHRLESWYRTGEDLNAKLPLLATYMGHRSMLGTQWYLQLTQTLFTDLADRLDEAFGHVVPGEADS